MADNDNDDQIECNRCGYTKKSDLFSKGRRICKACRVVYAVEWARRNPEKRKAVNRRYNVRTGRSSALPGENFELRIEKRREQS